ncbi:chondrolectin isoform X2 [Echeneis naucrates]|uniref:Chondrolectin-like n=1 Tax=Echeneis naucrates TaxID=173247 RepID=A0A665UN53_ECHNA|nr:chondrolectin-like isoform X2 [Echeneis naucrates]
MDFMKLFGTVIAVFFHPGSASKLNGQRICRRGTERPCYKVSYIQDSRQRLTFEEARKACRLDGGELLSIETEGEQRMIERLIQQLQAGDGDFWIGLRRSQQWDRAGTTSQGCPSQYYWLDGSKAKFRNWHWDEPSCGGEMCVVLYYQPSAPPDEEGHFLFQWNDNNCNSKNNFVCKYSEEKVPPLSEEENTAHPAPVPSLRTKLFSTTESDERIKLGLPESSVSLSDNTLYLFYILYATIPALLLLLFAVAGFFCYKQHAKRGKTESENDPCRSKPWMSPTASHCSIQGPYAFSDITKLPHTALDSSMPVDIMAKYSSEPFRDSHCDYENVSCMDRESGFVTNDIYETCRTQSQHCSSQTGWVENEIYG